MSYQLCVQSYTFYLNPYVIWHTFCIFFNKKKGVKSYGIH
jgi:hypothetical protein